MFHVLYMPLIGTIIDNDQQSFQKFNKIRQITKAPATIAILFALARPIARVIFDCRNIKTFLNLAI